VSSEVEPGRFGPDGVRICSIADAMDVIGDRYTMLVLREIALGFGRFSDMRRHIGAPRETLTLRLRRLEDAGIIARRRYSEHPPRDEYLLTEAGRALVPVLQGLRAWGERYVTPTLAT
jgi:DNA-binding HxlR family transcriptional regulator